MSLMEEAHKVARAVEAAGALIQAIQAEPLHVEEKVGGAGPLTRADLESDALLRDELCRVRDAAWLSEETVDDLRRLSADLVWIVDPLDGTKEFVAGVPEYAVAAALVEGGEPVIGAVHNPATGLTVWAAKGAGCFLGSGERAFAKESTVLLASRSEIRSGEFDAFRGDWDVVATGSIQYKLALIASGCGAATVSRGPKHEWDVCAGALLVAEAGGVAATALGEPLLYNRSLPKVPGVLAAAPLAYERLLATVRSIGVSERMNELQQGA